MSALILIFINVRNLQIVVAPVPGLPASVGAGGQGGGGGVCGLCRGAELSPLIISPIHTMSDFLCQVSGAMWGLRFLGFQMHLSYKHNPAAGASGQSRQFAEDALNNNV